MILLDTHVLVWWVSDKQKLSRAAHRAIIDSQKQGGIAVSAISIWELAMLLEKGRLVITMEPEQWLRQIEASEGLQIIAVDAAIARDSVFLPGALHEDPADRIIIATARAIGIPLITADKKIREYPHVITIW